jgi:hypothetical protein
MNREQEVKKLVNFERSVPRCGTCKNFKAFKFKKTANVQNRNLQMCMEINFKVTRGSCCDLWENQKGETID